MKMALLLLADIVAFAGSHLASLQLYLLLSTAGICRGIFCKKECLQHGQSCGQAILILDEGEPTHITVQSFQL